MADSLDAPLRLVLGDEELLVSRAVAEVVTAARDSDPETDVRELPAGELVAGDLYDLLSPSLFGGRRVVVLRGAHEAKTDVIDALRAYVADPTDEVVLVVVHPGGARGKALVDGMRKAGAVVVECAKLTRAEERQAFVRAEVARAGGTINPSAVAVLLDAVGASNVNATMTRLGLQQTHIVDRRRGESGEHVTTADDMATLLARLVQQAP